MKKLVIRENQVLEKVGSTYWGALYLCVAFATASVVGLAISENLYGNLSMNAQGPCCQNTSLLER